MEKLEKDKLDLVEKAIKEAGEYAVKMQENVHRNKKADGSILTEVDLEISHRILSLISKLFPEEAIISEEETTEEKDNTDYTFILDPIDGTDVYSQGLASFAIALGILDKDKNPAGAMIYAPRFGISRPDLFVRLDPGSNLYVDGKLFKKRVKREKTIQITMGSKSHKEFDFSHFDGKIRTFGSSVIHLLLPAILEQFDGAVIEPCFVWDITSSLAILRKEGMDIEYSDGEKFEYTNDFIWKKVPFKRPIYAGTKELRDKLKTSLRPL